MELIINHMYIQSFFPAFLFWEHKIFPDSFNLMRETLIHSLRKKHKRGKEAEEQRGTVSDL